MTHEHVGHDSLGCVTWLMIHRCLVIGKAVCVTWLVATSDMAHHPYDSYQKAKCLMYCEWRSFARVWVTWHLCTLQLQHTATHCNTLQHTATHCNTLQQTATHCNRLQHTATHYESYGSWAMPQPCHTYESRTATHCNTLQHTATHCNRLHATAMSHLWITCVTWLIIHRWCSVLQCVAVCCSVLQRVSDHP